jgi:hypothetical protein
MIWVCNVGIVIVGCLIVWCMEVISVFCLCGMVGNLVVVVSFVRWTSSFLASSSSIYLISIASSLSYVS